MWDAKVSGRRRDAPVSTREASRVEIPKECLAEKGSEVLSLPDGFSSSETRVMSRKRRAWFEEEEQKMFSLEQLGWDNLRRSDFTLGRKGAFLGRSRSGSGGSGGGA